MKKYLLLLFFLALTLVISSIVLGLLLSLKKGIDSKENNLLETENLKLELYSKELLQESVLNNGLNVNLSEIECFNENNKTTIDVEKPKLVYYYSALNCSSCVEFGENKLKDHFSDYENNNNLLFVISDYPGDKQVAYMNCFNLRKNYLKIPIEQANLPFYFLLINNQIEHMFIPDKAFPEYTDTYLQEIKKRYFTDNR